MANTSQVYIARHYLKKPTKMKERGRRKREKGMGEGREEEMKEDKREETRKDEIRLTYTVKTVAIVEKSVRRSSAGRC